MSLLERIRKRKAQRDECLKENRLYNKNHALSYITGSSALNIPYNGVQCDWHQIDTLKAGLEGRFVTHPATIIGAEDIFGTFGIWDCSEWLHERGFKGKYQCATPIRAIIDILYYWIAVKERYPQTLDNLRDYMIDEIDFNTFSQMLKTLQDNLSENQVELLKRWEEKNEIYR